MAARRSPRKQRARTSAGVVILFVLSFASHEWGEAVHSVISLGFTAALLQHLRNNWSRYRLSLMRTASDRSRKGAVDSVQLVVVGVVIVSGLVLWIADGQDELHEVTGVLILAIAAVHMFLHRRSLLRLLAQLRP